MLPPNLLKQLHFSSDKAHISMEQHHFLDQQQVSNHVPLFPNLLKHLHFCSGKPHPSIKQQYLLDQQQISNPALIPSEDLKPFGQETKQ
jgi:hypothetical protein